MMKLKNSVRVFAIIILLFSFATFLFAYIMVQSFTSRIRYTSERCIEHCKNRTVLEQQFHAQRVSFMTADGIQLAGLLIIRPGAQKVWLLCHGYRMAKERLLPFASLFDQDSLLMFDYRAHGESQGNYTTFGFHERNDIHAAVAFLKKHPATCQLPLYGLGISMGAVSLLGAAIDNNHFKAIVLDSPFAQLTRQVKRMITDRYHLPTFFFVPVGTYLLKKRLRIPIEAVNTLEWGARLTTPGLFIYSMDDNVALASDVQEIYQTISTTKDAWCVPTCQHARIFTHFPEEYRKRVYAFLEHL